MAKSICLFLSAILFWNSSITAQKLPPAARVRGGVRLVVIVLDKSGHPIIDLRQQDFTVFDDGVLRPIRAFGIVNGNKQPPAFQSVDLRAATQSFLANVPRYEMTFDPALAPELKEYHRVEVRVDRPDLRVITSQGYYTARN